MKHHEIIFATTTDLEHIIPHLPENADINILEKYLMFSTEDLNYAKNLVLKLSKLLTRPVYYQYCYDSPYDPAFAMIARRGQTIFSEYPLDKDERFKIFYSLTRNIEWSITPDGIPVHPKDYNENCLDVIEMPKMMDKFLQMTHRPKPNITPFERAVEFKRGLKVDKAQDENGNIVLTYNPKSYDYVTVSHFFRNKANIKALTQLVANDIGKDPGLLNHCTLATIIFRHPVKVAGEKVDSLVLYQKDPARI